MCGGFTLYSILSYIFPFKDARVHCDYDWSVEEQGVLDGQKVDGTCDEEKGVEHSNITANKV